jgi:hypothetical protein
MLKKFLLLSCSLLNPCIFCQISITGHVESVPSKSNAYARITLKNTSDNTEYVAYTNPGTGNFEINIPSGNYDRKVEVQNNFLFADALAVDGSQIMNLQSIQDLGKESTVYGSILEVNKVLTFTLDWSPNIIMERWRDEDMPIKVYARNYDPSDPYSMPPEYRSFFDSAINDIETKSASAVMFSEQSSPVDIGINFEYRKTDDMPQPVNGWTIYEELYPDNSLKRVTIYINRETLSSDYAKNRVFRKELMRALATTDDSIDPIHLMSSTSQTSVLSNDEGKALQIMYTLKNLTDMSKHKYTVVTAPVPVELTRFSFLQQNNIVKLLWNTATEVNNYGFDIERKLYSWKSIGFVRGNGTSNSPKDYIFVDTLKQPGNYVYRLKQVDNDGSFEYSPEVNVDLDDIVKTYALMQNYPNPINPSTVIKYSLPQESYIQLIIYNSLGQVVKELVNTTQSAGNFEQVFNGSNFSSGVYFYSLFAKPLNGENEFRQVKKLILLK